MKTAEVVKSMAELLRGVPMTPNGPAVYGIITQIRGDWKWQRDTWCPIYCQFSFTDFVKKTVVGTVCMVFHGHVPSPLNAKFWNMTIQKLWFMDKQFQTQYIWTLLKMFNPTSLRNGWTYQLVTIATKYVIIAGWWQNQAYNLLRNWLDALCIHCNRFWLSASSMGPVVPLEQLAFL